jgi:transcription elongation factor GreA
MVKERTVRLTAAGRARLEAELRHLTTAKRPALATRIQEATEHGDVSDNSEYEELKEEFVLTEARIRELEQTLGRAELVQRDAGDDTIGLGSVVTLRADDGEEETWTVVSPEEANTLDGTISTESPVGRALLGCRAGDSPTVNTPGGAVVFTVVRVA